MESTLKNRNRIRKKRALRVRKNVRGSALKPRLSVTRTNQHVHVQLIDDDASKTLASTSTLSKEFKGTEKSNRNTSSAKQLGLVIAQLAQKKDVIACVFDRGRYKYHGIIAAVADGAREGGLKF